MRGLFLATEVLGERMSFSRLLGAVVIVSCLAVIGGESIGHIGLNGVMGDMIFVLTGFMFAGFTALVRYWRVAGYHAMNSLRMEKGYRHWGHDITDEDTPLEAGLGFRRVMGQERRVFRPRRTFAPKGKWIEAPVGAICA